MELEITAMPPLLCILAAFLAILALIHLDDVLERAFGAYPEPYLERSGRAPSAWRG